MITTERCLLRPWRASDRDGFARMARDEKMMRHVTQGEAWSDEKIDSFMQRQAALLNDHGMCFLAMTALMDDEVIGLAGMQPLDDGRFEIGWWVWREHWGNGYALEAASALLTPARELLGLDQLIAVIDPDNTASIRVAEKLGMNLAERCLASETRAERPAIPVLCYHRWLAASPDGAKP